MDQTARFLLRQNLSVRLSCQALRDKRAMSCVALSSAQWLTDSELTADIMM
jgi:hypothetical protein